MILGQEKQQVTIPKWSIYNKGTRSNYYNKVQFVFNDAAQQQVKTIKTGRQAQMRATIDTGRITRFVMTDPGSGYPCISTVDVTIHKKKTQDATIDVRMGNRVLGQPAFKNRGALYTKFNAVTISSTGYADKYQTGEKIIIDGLTLLPSPGDNLRFAYYRCYLQSR